MAKTHNEQLVKIPILDFTHQYKLIKEEVEQAVKKVLESGAYILGLNVEAFEEELATYLGCGYVISCANGTDALVLALRALDIGSGDEVITVSHSFFATSEAVALVGATPIFVDIREDDYNIDTTKIENAITKKTKAIIPVHIYGQPCEIEDVIKIARRNNLYVIEDSAQALGAKYNGKFVGTFGDVGTTSFYPTKNLGACGDGGAVFTNDSEIREKICALRVHGSPKRYVHDFIGYNSRLDEIQAAILRIKLKYLDLWNKSRAKIAYLYSDLLKNTGDIVIPVTKKNCTHIFHQYTIRTKKRDELANHLKVKGIDTLIYYPVPIHKQKAFDYLNYKNFHLPVTEKISHEILSLPMYPELSQESQRIVVEEIKRCFV